MNNFSGFDSEQIIMALIVICSIILVLMVFSGVVRAVFRMGFCAILGMVGIYVLNIYFPEVGIGINPLTAAVSGILGVPGFAALVVAGLVL